ncbi:sigma-70 family RNA polymerase sigma factor [Cytophagales bacterium RKSG123]|nr:sigma-70 family RNA polymerase sigma factor [Xanthovirga aplysinae]
MSMTEDLLELIEGCKSNCRNAQETLYRKYYGYAMSICLLYSKTRAEAEEIAHDGFLKVFSKIKQYDANFGFKSWIRRIFINSAIDYFRRNRKHYEHDDLEEARGMESFNDNAIDQLAAQEIMLLVQDLSPSYQMVFNLYVMEGYKHHEIAEQLGITEGTSKSNLAKARNKLKLALSHMTS